MKLSLALLILGLSAAFSTQAEAQQMGHGHGTTTSFVYKNLTFQYQLSDDDFKHTQSWNPETDESPLSTRKALEVARLNLHRFVQDADKFEVEKINLERFEPNKWVFEVGFHCWDNRCSDTAVSFIVFVKMDGSVIEPQMTANQKDVNLRTQPNKRLERTRR
jgi:hypothetical protein